MRVYVINKMQGFRAYVDDTGLTVEQNKNRELHINDSYIDLLARLTNEYSNINDLYKEACYRLEPDYASVFLTTEKW